jgi:lysophospholipase L1-like esterase
MSYWLGYFLILFLGCGGLTGLLVYLRRRGKVRPFFENLIVMMLALSITLMGVEFYFKVFFAQMDSLRTLARQNWYERYYQGAINSLGYRDVEWTEEMVDDKIKVMVVGDSFAEGVGIESPDDRFSNLLAQKLGPNYVVFNLGKRGANTKQEIEAILNYPYSPDILILSYFINDIEDVEWWYSQDRPPDPSTPAMLSPVVQNSYAANFLYWRLFRLFKGNHLEAWWTWLLSLYDNPEAWWLHQQDLLNIYKAAQSEQIPMIVVVFPNLAAIESSKTVTDRVLDLYSEKGVPTLDVAELIEGIPTSELVVSPVDAHPSKLVHRLTADALYEMFVELDLSGGTTLGKETQ